MRSINPFYLVRKKLEKQQDEEIRRRMMKLLNKGGDGAELVKRLLKGKPSK